MNGFANKGGSFIKESATHFFILALNSVTPLVTIPILLANLSQSEYGLVSLYQVYIQYFGIILVFSAHSLLQNEAVKSEKPISILSSTLVFTLVNSFLFGLITLFVASFTSIPTFDITILLFTAMVNSIFLVINSYMQIMRMLTKYLVLSVAFLVSSIVSIFLIIDLFTLSYIHRFSAIFLSQLLYIGVFIYLIKDGYNFTNQFITLKFRTYYHWGIKLLPHSILVVFLATFDKIALSRAVSLQDLGVYALHYQAYLPLFMSGMVLNFIFKPKVFSKLKQNLQVGQELTIHICVSILLFIIYNAAILLLAYLLDYRILNYQIDGQLLLVISLSILLQNLYYPFSNVLLFKSQGNFMSLTMIIVCLALTLVYVLNKPQSLWEILWLWIFIFIIYTAALFLKTIVVLKKSKT